MAHDTIGGIVEVMPIVASTRERNVIRFLKKETKKENKTNSPEGIRVAFLLQREWSAAPTLSTAANGPSCPFGNPIRLPGLCFLFLYFGFNAIDAWHVFLAKLFLSAGPCRH